MQTITSSPAYRVKTVLTVVGLVGLMVLGTNIFGAAEEAGGQGSVGGGLGAVDGGQGAIGGGGDGEVHHNCDQPCPRLP